MSQPERLQQAALEDVTGGGLLSHVDDAVDAAKEIPSIFGRPQLPGSIGAAAEEIFAPLGNTPLVRQLREAWVQATAKGLPTSF